MLYFFFFSKSFPGNGYERINFELYHINFLMEKGPKGLR